jgi:cell wall-associated NlpC family hydrolase
VARYRYRRRGQDKLLLALVAVVAVAGLGAHSAVGGRAPNAAARQAISYAEAQMGKPYAWGGTGPDAYDCSGLVYEAYLSAGVTIPRTSEAQWSGLRHIRAGHQRPGDLVFFPGADGTWNAPGHVGLVLSRHRMVEAYAAGYPIRISHYGTPDSPAGDQAPAGFARPTG